MQNERSFWIHDMCSIFWVSFQFEWNCFFISYSIRMPHARGEAAECSQTTAKHSECLTKWVGNTDSRYKKIMRGYDCCSCYGHNTIGILDGVILIKVFYPYKSWTQLQLVICKQIKYILSWKSHSWFPMRFLLFIFFIFPTVFPHKFPANFALEI